jgi:hypothetical protein
MAGPGDRRFDGGPEKQQLEAWVKQGYTDTEIGQIWAELTGETEPPSKQAVFHWRQKQGVQRTGRAPQLDHSAVRPWRVKIEHVGDGIEHRLYDYSRRKQGRKLSASAERLLDDFLAFLTEHNVVVDYDPDTARGWLFRLRDPEIDDPDNIIRRPEHARDKASTSA